MMFDQQVKR